MSAGNLDQRLDTFRQRVVGRSISEATFTDYERWIRRFEAWLEQENRQAQGIAELEDFDELLADSSRTGYPWANGRGRPVPGAYAYRSRINAISAAKKWIRREYNVRVPETPSDICIGSAQPFDPTYIPPDDINDILNSAHSCGAEGCEAALRLSYDAILRASELVRVKAEDVDLSAGTVYVRASKGSGNAEVGIDDRTQQALAQFMSAHPNRERLFRNSYGRAWRPAAWSVHVLRHHCDDGSHALGRHTPIMNRLEGADPPFMAGDYSNEDFGSVYRRARHRNPTMTTKYARIIGIDVPGWAGDD